MKVNLYEKVKLIQLLEHDLECIRLHIDENIEIESKEDIV